MKKLFAIVLAVVMIASLGGVALADNFQPTGNGALSGPHYNLNIIGVENAKNPPMDNSNGHTIFVPLKGRAKIDLANSSDENVREALGITKDFEVLDRNAFDDPALFALPEPVIDPDACPDGSGLDTVQYTVYARALGAPGNKSFTTTCETDGSEVYCSSITMKLVRPHGKSLFTDVTKYLLFIYIDGTRHSIFDDEFMDYFWRYDNDGLRLAQLRFYMTPTCIPDTAPAMEMVLDEGCVEPGGSTGVTITGSYGADFTGVTADDIYIVGEDGKNDKTITLSNVSGSAALLTFDMAVGAGSVVETKTIYITDATGTTMSTTFEVSATCD